jgi:hypothetical protein
MSDAAFYRAKIAECLRLVETSDDPLFRDVYKAMADEFACKLAVVLRAAGPAAPVVGSDASSELFDGYSRDSKPRRGAIA